MGNCIDTCSWDSTAEETQRETDQPQKREDGLLSDDDQKSTSGGVRLKIVLTKEELEWLILEMKDKKWKRIEDVLEEIERERGREKAASGGWKPSLESIMESPEVMEHMDR